jgi:hypothetical protein
MPPQGKGDPLTADQVSLLRAWIDQGAKWGAVTNAPKMEFAITPELRWFTVKGNERMFREQTGIKDGFSGGAESIFFREQSPKERTLTVEAKTFFNPEEYKVKLSLEQRDLGFIRMGAENYREYYNDVGGYFPTFTPSQYSLNRDLHLDIGKFWVDLGLTLPDWPKMTFGYEYDVRDGTKSILEWGDVGTIPPTTDIDNTDAKKIYPAAQSIKEHVHIVKFDLTHEVYGVGIENRFRAEFYDNRTSRDPAGFYNAGTQTLENYVVTKESENHFQASDSLRLDKQLLDWLYVSGGYRYSRLQGDYSFNNTTVSPIGVFGPGDNFWFGDNIMLEQDSHVGNLNAQLGPWSGLTFYGGAQAEWMSQRGFGSVNLDEGVPGALISTPATVDADLSRAVVEEHLGVRYTTIPYTVLFAEGRLAQESISQFEDQVGGDHEFLRDTDASSALADARTGFTLSPDPRISLTAQYRHRDKSWSYNHLRDEQFGVKNEGYSAFITSRDTDTDDISVKLALRPLSWLQSALTYQHVTSKYKTGTDSFIIPGFVIPGLPPFPEQIIAPGGVLFTGDYRADIYGASINVTPWHRLTLSSSFTFANSRTSTAQNVTPAVVDYAGDTYSSISMASFALDAKTDLTGSYSYSWADYGQSNFATGLPVGIVYHWHIVSAGVSRKISSTTTASLQYRYYNYDEPNTGGANNYTAHGIIAAVTIALK